MAGEPVNIVDHDLLLSGRPQVYVPMAVPMRLTNNDKCNADEYGPGQTPSDNKVFSYCNDEVASAYGLQDFCADTVDIPQGPHGRPRADLRQRGRPAQRRQHRFHPAPAVAAGL